jgi:hypothetical protein
MKKIALTVAAFASLGLVACGGGTEEADTNATNVVATSENAVEDVVAAENAAINAADNALDDAANAVDNASDAVANAH